MNPTKNRDRILEAIDQLRRRKARPDNQRICNYLFRRFSVNSLEAKSDLQWCVENDIVLKVEYKGSISYRNASKKYSHVKRLDSQDFGDTKANRKFAQLLTNAFGELVVQEPDYLEYGVPVDEIINNILSKDSVRYTKKYIAILIDKEVENGGLIRLENDKFLMGPQKNEPYKYDHLGSFSKKDSYDQSQDLIKIESPESMDPDMKTGILRVGGRRKRAKKVFDPSDTHIPKKRGRPAGSLNKATIEKQLAKLSDDSRPESRTSTNSRDTAICLVCHNKKGLSDRMVTCRECNNKVHFSCLIDGGKGEHTCPNCKTCVSCYETTEAGFLTVCGVCGDAYHSACHEPRIPEKLPFPKWICTNCEVGEDVKHNPNVFSHKVSSFDEHFRTRIKKEVDEITNESSPSMISGNSTPNYRSPSLSPRNDDGQSDSQSNKDSDEDIDPSIPDATNWTIDDVYEYFVQFFPNEAKIFKEQEIDGRSLLLLRRIDVLTSLNLKLGPALKMYKHIVKLQVRRDDPKLYWL